MLVGEMFAVLCFFFALFDCGAGDPCLQGWLLFEESCYGFGSAEVTWGDAEEMCRTIGAKLAEIETSEENDFLIDQAHIKDGDRYWLGGSDVFDEGVWVWMSSGQLMTFKDWHVDQPDDFNRHEDCLNMVKVHDYHWNDSPCDNQHAFVCEMPAAETVVG